MSTNRDWVKVQWKRVRSTVMRQHIISEEEHQKSLRSRIITQDIYRAHPSPHPPLSSTKD